MPVHIEIRGLTGMPEVREGDDLALLILGAAGSSDRVRPRDVVVVA
ncbi:MAG: coenzyme F420-0:L-glutamate ligase, partial [Chloroflexi bacterium]|nr:coenzyme F420-0:L-glutamate ligase [Chloroflexota bacterium]